MKVLTFVIYSAFLVASYWHLYLCFELLSPSSIAAHLLAGGFELYLWFSSYSYAYYIEKGQYRTANQIAWLPRSGVFVVWLGNWVAMQKHFLNVDLHFVPFGIDISEALKWLIPLIVSLYIPIGTLGLGKLLGTVVQDRKVNVERWIQKNYSKYSTAEELREVIKKEFGATVDIRRLRKFYTNS